MATAQCCPWNHRPPNGQVMLVAVATLCTSATLRLGYSPPHGGDRKFVRVRLTRNSAEYRCTHARPRLLKLGLITTLGPHNHQTGHRLLSQSPTVTAYQGQSERTHAPIPGPPPIAVPSHRMLRAVASTPRHASQCVESV